MSKISIIIPMYNAEKYIARCLESVINQSFNNIEIIIVNDGSTDESLEICKKYGEVDERIIILNKRNSGVSVARNEGMNVATGEYVMFVDADDWIDESMCQDLYKRISECQADICFCNNIKEYGNKSEYIDFGISKDVISLDEIKEVILSLIEEKDKKIAHRRETFRGPCAKLYKRSIIIDKNITFNKELAIGEDLVFNLEYLKYCKKIVVERKFLYHYRVNLQSATKRYRENAWDTYRKLLVILEEYLKSNFSKEEYIDRLNKLKLKYFIISINNEMSKSNKKGYVEKIRCIKSICEDEVINFALKNASKGTRGPKNRIKLFLLRNIV